MTQVTYQTRPEHWSIAPGLWPTVQLTFIKDWAKVGLSTLCTIEAEFDPPLEPGNTTFLIPYEKIPLWAKAVTNIKTEPKETMTMQLNYANETGWAFDINVPMPPLYPEMEEGQLITNVTWPDNTTMSVTIQLVKVGKIVTGVFTAGSKVMGGAVPNPGISFAAGMPAGFIPTTPQQIAFPNIRPGENGDLNMLITPIAISINPAVASWAPGDSLVLIGRSFTYNLL